jgi:uncharacterized protein (DUF4415 family)
MRKSYDFSAAAGARRAKDVPHLARLQQAAKAGQLDDQLSGKTRITMWMDASIVESFKQLAGEQGNGYQTEINRALKAYLSGSALTLDAIRDEVKAAVREELGAKPAAKKVAPAKPSASRRTTPVPAGRKRTGKLVSV